VRDPHAQGQCEAMSEEEAKNFVTLFDLNGDGELGLEEFITMMSSRETMSEVSFAVPDDLMLTLSPEDQAKVKEIQQSLEAVVQTNLEGGPRGPSDVRLVTLYKQSQATRVGIIFHEHLPFELMDLKAGSQVTPPVVKVVDAGGIASGAVTVGSQLLSVNGTMCLSNFHAIQLMKTAIGEMQMAFRDTKLSRGRTRPQ